MKEDLRGKIEDLSKQLAEISNKINEISHELNKINLNFVQGLDKEDFKNTDKELEKDNDIIEDLGDLDDVSSPSTNYNFEKYNNISHNDFVKPHVLSEKNEQDNKNSFTLPTFESYNTNFDIVNNGNSSKEEVKAPVKKDYGFTSFDDIKIDMVNPSADTNNKAEQKNKEKKDYGFTSLDDIKIDIVNPGNANNQTVVNKQPKKDYGFSSLDDIKIDIVNPGATNNNQEAPKQQTSNYGFSSLNDINIDIVNPNSNM
ncbi:MAG: hypothetical protein MR296_03805 [Tenericutes bacterium]|nr:hypothetical protein [Mycoplasmatota bacterium]